MKLEELTKQQIVLLTLLVSFVTSIATGIITVSLVDQAPQAVTQTVNRVVEKTIERVIPATDTKGAVKETTVVVNEEDLTISSIEKNSKSMVRITGTRADLTERYLGIGLVVSKGGLIVTKKTYTPEESYEAVFPDGKKSKLTVVSSMKSNPNFSIFQISDLSVKPVPATIGDSDRLKLGQTIIAIGGREENSVSVGIVTGLKPAAVSLANEVAGGFASIDTDIISKENTAGGPLVNLSGEVVGLRLDVSGSNAPQNSFLPVNLVKKLISEKSGNAN